MQLNNILSIIPACDKIQIVYENESVVYTGICAEFRATMNDGSEYFNDLLNTGVIELHVNDKSELVIIIEN